MTEEFNPEREISNEEIYSMSPDEVEELREKLTMAYREHDHHNPRRNAKIRDSLIRLHKSLTTQFIVPKRIER